MLKKIILVLSIMMLPMTALAAGEECTSDEDCKPGDECVRVDCACEDPDDCECLDSGYCQEVFYHVDSCVSDADCPDGGYCIIETCACPDGAECDCPAVEGYCEYGEDPWDAECEVDADCPTGMACELVGLPCEINCPPCACDCKPEDEACDCECPACEPTPCEEELYGYCTYVQQECEASSDCATGFVCETQEVCSGGGDCICSSCACAACPEGEDCPPCDCPEEPVCECDDVEPECYDEGICVPEMETCEENADCQEGFECMEISSGGDCACGCECAVINCGPDDEDCEQPTCECPPCDCPEPETESVCMPEGWNDYYETDIGANEDNTAEQGAPKGDDEEETNEPVTPAAQDADPEPVAAANDDVIEVSSNGCSMADKPLAPAGLMLMLLAALGGLLIPRRRTNR
jgi:hypothetical protein